MRSILVVAVTAVLLVALGCYEPPPETEPVPQWYWNNGPTSADLYDLASTAENDVWMVGVSRAGKGEVFSCLGYYWSAEILPWEAPPLYTVDAIPDGAVWAAGGGNVFIYRDRGTWKKWDHPAPGTDIYCLRMIDDVSGWAVGEGGRIFKFDGLAWTEVTSPATANLRRIQILAADNIWAVGDAGTVLHYEGAAWTPVTFPAAVNLYDLHFLSGSDGWVVGDEASAYHWNGTSWKKWDMPNDTMIYRCCAFPKSNQGWAGGDQMHLAHYNGTKWAFEEGTPSGSWSLNAIHFAAAGQGWAVGPAGTVLHYH